jgi:N-6 DNA Methylase
VVKPRCKLSSLISKVATENAAPGPRVWVVLEFGRPPAKNGDYAYLLHVIKSLKSTGKAAVIMPHGVLFRGHAEASIRKELLKRGYIKGVIGLPANLFYGTGIPACVVVIDKENAAGRAGVFMIDASKGFMKDGPKNRLRSQDIHKIVDVFTNQAEIERYSRMVQLTEIVHPKNDYNLNIPRYIDSSEPEDIQDLHAHLHGGIPDPDWAANRRTSVRGSDRNRRKVTADSRLNVRQHRFGYPFGVSRAPLSCVPARRGGRRSLG